MVNCNQIAVESARLKAMFEKCYNLKAIDLRDIVELIESVNACATGSFNLKTINGQSLFGVGDLIITANVDGTETKIQQGTGITISGNGSVVNPYVITNTLTQPNGSETKINQGSNIVIGGTGTIANPYVINAIIPVEAKQVNSDWSSISGPSLILNKPVIPSAQVNSDWNAVSGIAMILNKPNTLNTNLGYVQNKFGGEITSSNGTSATIPLVSDEFPGLVSKGMLEALSSDLNNIKLEFKISMPTNETNEGFATSINTREFIEITGNQIPTFKAIKIDGEDSKIFYVEILGRGKGGYGINGYQLSSKEVRFTSFNLTGGNIEDLPGTQIINLGVNFTDVVSVINSRIPNLIIQGQEKGYVLIKGTFDGTVYKEYLWIGAGGIYGGEIGASQASYSDLKELTVESIVRATSTASGTVKTNLTVGDPVVYLKETSDLLLNEKEDKINKAIDFSTINNVKYPTVQAVKAYADSKVADVITDGVTNIAPSQNAVHDALALKQLVFTGIDQSQFLTENDIVIDNTALTLTIATVKKGTAISVSNPVIFYTDGNGIAIKYTKTTPVVFTFTNTTGVWYFYFNSSGNPIASQTPPTDSSTIARVYRIYWNSTLAIADKRVIESLEVYKNDATWVDRDWKDTQGAQYSSGFVLGSNVLASGTPAIDGSNAVVNLTSGIILDSNLVYTLSNASTGTVKFTQDLGTGLLPSTSGKFICITNNASLILDKIPATDFPFLWNATTNTPEYLTQSGVRTGVSANNFFVYYLYAIQDPRRGETIKIKSAEIDFANSSLADGHSWSQLQSLFPTLRDSKIRLLYKLVFEHKTAYDIGTKKSVLRKVEDLRKQRITSTSTAGGIIPASNVVVTISGGISSTNAQLALEELDLEKENTSNKQNSLTVDGTGVKFPTVDAVNASVVKTTGNQTIAGAKTIDNSVYPRTNYFNFINNYNSGTNNRTVDNTSFSIVNNYAGIGSHFNNVANGWGSYYFNQSTGVALGLDSKTGSTGDLMQFSKNEIIQSRISHDGKIYTPYGSFGTSTGVALPQITVTNGTSPSVIEFPKTGFTMVGTVGALGSYEMNMSTNMDYTSQPGVHRFYDNTKPATWLAIGDSFWQMQSAPASLIAGDVWNLQGQPRPFYQRTDTGLTRINTNVALSGTGTIGDAMLGVRRTANFASISGEDDLVIEGAKTKGVSAPVYINTYNVGNVSLVSGGGNLGVGTISPIGKANIITGITGATINMASQEVGSFSFANGGSTTAVPTLIGKSNDGTGIQLQAGTNNTNAGTDMLFGVRENDNTDFATLTSSAFRFSRFGTTLLDILRNGNSTFTGTVTATSYSGSATLTGTPTAPTATLGTNTTQIATTAYSDALVSDTNYDATSWNGITGIAPSKNAVRDKIETIQTQIDGKQAILTNPITGTGTAGKVSFWNGTSSQTGDASLFWDNTNKRLGIGNPSPTRLLDVLSNNSTPGDSTAYFKNTSANGACKILLDNNTGGGFSLQSSGSNYAGNPLYSNVGDFSIQGTLSVLNFTTNGDVSTGGTAKINFMIGGFNETPTMTFDRYKVGVGITSPTAKLNIAAGTSTAGTAPLKLTSGSLLTTPEAGAVEFLNNAYYGTITTGAERKTFAFLEAPTFTTSVTSPSFVKSGGTSSQFLKADGSVDTNSYTTGTLTTNYLPKDTGANSLGNSQLTDDGVDMMATGSNARFRGATSTSRFSLGNSTSTAYIDFYGQTHATIPNDITLITAATGRIRLFTNSIERVNIANNGVLNVANLAGTGTRTVVADASGNLSASSANGGTKTITQGTATLVGGTVTVSTSAALTGSIVILSLNTPGGTLGISYASPSASIVNATSFVINSVSTAGVLVSTDTSTINWQIIN